jgi:hypothetical protein
MSDWHNKIDVTYSVSTYFFLSNTTTVTNDSFVSDSFVFSTSTFKIFYWSKILSQKDHHAQACAYELIVSGKTSPLDSFKIDSGEASPIDILLNLLQDSYLYYYSIIHHSSYY